MARGRRRGGRRAPGAAQTNQAPLTPDQEPAGPVAVEDPAPIAAPRLHLSVFQQYVHNIASELLATQSKVETMRDQAASLPNTPPELVDRLERWVEAFAVSHRHSGSILAVFDEMQKRELGLD